MEAVPTKFAPAALAPAARLQADHALVTGQKVLLPFLSTLNTMVAILNPERQLVHASEEFLKFRGLGGAYWLGKRLGQVLQCVHAGEEAGGCGTSESCSVCRATEAILESGKTAGKVSRECRLTVRSPRGLGTLDLEVTSTAWELEGRPFTVMTLKDTSADKRKQSLERIFFHDIVNTAGGLAGTLDLLAEYSDLNQGKDLIGMSRRSSQDILEEIVAFQQLKQAEAGELIARPTALNPTRVVQEVVDRVRHHSVAEGRLIEIESDQGPALLLSDRLLLERVLVNMLKNALEASTSGSSVTIGWWRVPEGFQFRVHNAGTMARAVQLQVFQRSFSTKGSDRGLGTYSMRLIGESCLEGKVAFTSNQAGTEFTLTLPLQDGENGRY